MDGTIDKHNNISEFFFFFVQRGVGRAHINTTNTFIKPHCGVCLYRIGLGFCDSYVHTFVCAWAFSLLCRRSDKGGHTQR